MAQAGESWVVYLMTLPKQSNGIRAVCEQHEWEALEQARPAYRKLIQNGIATQREAELLARGTSGDPPVRTTKTR